MISRCSKFATRHSSFYARHSPFIIRHSPFVVIATSLMLALPLPRLELLAPLKCGKAPYALKLSRDGHRLFVANFASDEAGILNLSDPKGKMQTFYVGPEPIDLTLNSSEEKLFAANFRAGLITVVSTRDFRPVDNIKVGGQPVAIAVSPGGDRLFVANWGHTKFGQVDIIDAGNHQILKSVKVGIRPLALAVPTNGEMVYVANAGSDSITRIELRDYQTSEFHCIENPNGLALSKDDKWLYVAGASGSQLSMIDVKTGKEMRRANVGKAPFGIVVHPQGWVVTANKGEGTVSFLTDDLASVATTKVGKSPHYVIFSPDGMMMYVSLEKENKIAVLRIR